MSPVEIGVRQFGWYIGHTGNLVTLKIRSEQYTLHCDSDQHAQATAECLRSDLRWLVESWLNQPLPGKVEYVDPLAADPAIVRRQTAERILVALIGERYMPGASSVAMARFAVDMTDALDRVLRGEESK